METNDFIDRYVCQTDETQIDLDVGRGRWVQVNKLAAKPSIWRCRFHI